MSLKGWKIQAFKHNRGISNSCSNIQSSSSVWPTTRTFSLRIKNCNTFLQLIQKMNKWNTDDVDDFDIDRVPERSPNAYISDRLSHLFNFWRLVRRIKYTQTITNHHIKSLLLKLTFDSILEFEISKALKEIQDFETETDF